MVRRLGAVTAASYGRSSRSRIDETIVFAGEGEQVIFTQPVALRFHELERLTDEMRTLCQPARSPSEAQALASRRGIRPFGEERQLGWAPSQEAVDEVMRGRPFESLGAPTTQTLGRTSTRR